MKRMIPVALAILAPASTILAVIILMAGRGLPDSARAELTRYLAYRYPAAPPSISQVNQASRPWLFKPEMSGATYSPSLHYHATIHDEPITTGQSRKQPASDPLAESASSRLLPFPPVVRWGDNLRPLPYPPEEAWCVLLEPQDHTTVAVVLLALHMDLYGAEWVVHELPGTWSITARQAALAELACAVGLDPVSMLSFSVVGLSL